MAPSCRTSISICGDDLAPLEKVGSQCNAKYDFEKGKKKSFTVRQFWLVLPSLSLWFAVSHDSSVWVPDVAELFFKMLLWLKHLRRFDFSEWQRGRERENFGCTLDTKHISTKAINYLHRLPSPILDFFCPSLFILWGNCQLSLLHDRNNISLVNLYREGSMIDW